MSQQLFTILAQLDHTVLCEGSAQPHEAAKLALNIATARFSPVYLYVSDRPDAPVVDDTHWHKRVVPVHLTLDTLCITAHDPRHPGLDEHARCPAVLEHISASVDVWLGTEATPFLVHGRCLMTQADGQPPPTLVAADDGAAWLDPELLRTMQRHLTGADLLEALSRVATSAGTIAELWLTTGLTALPSPEEALALSERAVSFGTTESVAANLERVYGTRPFPSRGTATDSTLGTPEADASPDTQRDPSVRCSDCPTPYQQCEWRVHGLESLCTLRCEGKQP